MDNEKASSDVTPATSESEKPSEASSSRGEVADSEIEEFFKTEDLRENLKKNVSERKFETVRKLTENPQKFVENVKVEDWTEIIDLSAEKEFFEIFKELQKLKDEYEKKLNVKLDFKYKNVLEDISKLHADISDGKIDEIESFMKNYPKLKLCYDSNDFCALERSIEAEQFHIYAFLRAKGFKADENHRQKRETKNVKPDQRLCKMIEDLTYGEQMEIRKENFQMALINPNYYVDLVFQGCVLDGPSNVNFFPKVKEMLESLYEIQEFKPIMEILALSEAKIFFDPENETIEKVDPTRSSCVYGVTFGGYKEIFVAKNENFDQLRGTFVHEATHLVLFLIYENN